MGAARGGIWGGCSQWHPTKHGGRVIIWVYARTRTSAPPRLASAPPAITAVMATVRRSFQCAANMRSSAEPTGAV